MLDWHRIPESLLAELLAALLAALLAMSLMTSSSSHAATPPLTLDEPARTTPMSSPLPQAEPDWLAIEDDHTGYAITLAGKWHEAPDSPEHESEVVRTTGWYFSRLYDCNPRECGSYVRAILSGGVLQANINIQTFADLKDQMPRREITRLAASIAGLSYIDPDELQPIKRAGAYGFRVRTSRPQEDGEAIGLVIDCLYHGNKFLILTAATALRYQEIGAVSLDAIAEGISTRPVDAASVTKPSK